MKRKLVCAILIGCLAFSLAACGEKEAVAPTGEVAPTSEVVESTQESEVVESTIEESTVEETTVIVEDSWPENVSEMFKPAFEKDPLFNGKVILTTSCEQAIEHMGEPDQNIVDGVFSQLYYNETNSAGNTIDRRFSYDVENGIVWSYGLENVTEKYFECDNDYYAIDGETFTKLVELSANVEKTEGRKSLTYEEVVEVLGVPGYVTSIITYLDDVDSIKIMWVNLDADNKTFGKYVMLEFDPDGIYYGRVYNGATYLEDSIP